MTKKKRRRKEERRQRSQRRLGTTFDGRIGTGLLPILCA